ncbi:hypothetical protein HYH03_000185 [Edaphochlamys debaryana]|uniref:Uncharacterized protein n=1 Tax=Edaphochlamys debaryana TaxID=47281 RepID=A0A835YI80_9CHLO|nr:hypothetical protein HYH03_000185 [Edaphochlamys debaryana]|eukprot:KAG2501683.1 hypothetical protein HYH03_000185 [Edaphochlamys debaryana]
MLVMALPLCCLATGRDILETGANEMALPLVVDDSPCASFNSDDGAPLIGNDGTVLGYALIRSGGSKTVDATGEALADGSTMLQVSVTLTDDSGMYFALDVSGSTGNVETGMTSFMPNNCPADLPRIVRQNQTADCNRKKASLTFDVPTELFNCSALDPDPVSYRVFFLMVRVDMAPAKCASSSNSIWAGSAGNTIRSGCSFITVTATCRPPTCAGYVARAEDGTPLTGGASVRVTVTSEDDMWRKVVPGVIGGAGGALLITIVIAAAFLIAAQKRRQTKRRLARAKRRASIIGGGHPFGSYLGGDGMGHGPGSRSSSEESGEEHMNQRTSRLRSTLYPGENSTNRFAHHDFGVTHSFAPGAAVAAAGGASEAHMRRMRLNSTVASNNRTLGVSPRGNVPAAAAASAAAASASRGGSMFWRSSANLFFGRGDRNRAAAEDVPDSPGQGLHFFQRQHTGVASPSAQSPGSVVLQGRVWDVKRGPGGKASFSTSNVPYEPERTSNQSAAAQSEMGAPEYGADWADAPDLPAQARKRQAAGAYRTSPDNPLQTKLEALASSSQLPSVVAAQRRAAGPRAFRGAALETIESGGASSAGTDATPSAVHSGQVSAVASRAGSVVGQAIPRSAAAAAAGASAAAAAATATHSRFGVSVNQWKGPGQGPGQPNVSAPVEGAPVERLPSGSSAPIRNLRVPSSFAGVMAGLAGRTPSGGAAAAAGTEGAGGVQPFVELGTVSTGSRMEQDEPPVLSLPDWVARQAGESPVARIPAAAPSAAASRAAAAAAAAASGGQVRHPAAPESSAELHILLDDRPASTSARQPPPATSRVGSVAGRLVSATGRMLSSGSGDRTPGGTLRRVQMPLSQVPFVQGAAPLAPQVAVMLGTGHSGDEVEPVSSDEVQQLPFGADPEPAAADKSAGRSTSLFGRLSGALRGNRRGAAAAEAGARLAEGVPSSAPLLAEDVGGSTPSASVTAVKGETSPLAATSRGSQSPGRVSPGSVSPGGGAAAAAGVQLPPPPPPVAVGPRASADMPGAGSGGSGQQSPASAPGSPTQGPPGSQRGRGMSRMGREAGLTSSPGRSPRGSHATIPAQQSPGRLAQQQLRRAQTAGQTAGQTAEQAEPAAQQQGQQGQGGGGSDWDWPRMMQYHDAKDE